MASLHHDGLINTFYDSEIVPGKKWDEEIQQQIRTADFVIFLLSADFIASDYIKEIEMPIALQRHDRGEAFVLPVWLDNVRLPNAIKERQILPDRPIKSMTHRSNGWVEVVNSIERLLNLYNTRVRAQDLGISMMYPQQFNSVMKSTLENASKVCLCSRTGSGWYRKHRNWFDGLRNKRVTRQFLFLNPNTSTFELDSRLKWIGTDHLSGFVSRVEERQSRAEIDYNHFTNCGHKVRVCDTLLPGVFWIVEKKSSGDRKEATAFLEVPIHREFYEGNLYVEIKQEPSIETYKGIFNALWKNSKKWQPSNLM
jgi:hypothetical protein